MVGQLRLGTGKESEQAVVEALLIHETSFFRDAHYFDDLARRAFPEQLPIPPNRPLTVWSAACAGGQEPYSIAMLLKERFGTVDSRDVRIIATDLSHAMLEQAREGYFSQIEIQRGVGSDRQSQFFERDEQRWRINSEMRSLVRFQHHNLISDEPPLSLFDLVLLRNVLIYFGEASRNQVLRSVHQTLRPTGRLMVGATEAMMLPSDLFERDMDFTVPCFRAL